MMTTQGYGCELTREHALEIGYNGFLRERTITLTTGSIPTQRTTTESVLDSVPTTKNRYIVFNSNITTNTFENTGCRSAISCSNFPTSGYNEYKPNTSISTANEHNSKPKSKCKLKLETVFIGIYEYENRSFKS